MLQVKEMCAECPLVKGLPQVVEDQFTTWGLTTAEKEVCRSLLVGMSLRQIADMRDTNEITVRQQALAIYAKAGLSGRRDLAAYFLKRIFEINT